MLRQALLREWLGCDLGRCRRSGAQWAVGACAARGVTLAVWDTQGSGVTAAAALARVRTRDEIARGRVHRDERVTLLPGLRVFEWLV